MRRYLLGTFVLLIVVFGVILAGRRNSPSADLDAPEHLTLFSIDGRDEDRRLKDVDVRPSETFWDYPVLGKVEITDPDMCKQLIAALKDGIARRPEDGLACFWPRHGIRAVEKGRTFEYAICFQCWRFHQTVEGKHQFGILNADVQPTFDKPLKEAGIPIAPK